MVDEFAHPQSSVINTYINIEASLPEDIPPDSITSAFEYLHLHLILSTPEAFMIVSRRQMIWGLYWGELMSQRF